MVDLSQPATIIEVLSYWISEIRKQVGDFLNSAFEEHPEEYSEYTSSFLLKYEGHDDRARVDVLPINLIILGAKYDLFEKFDAENRKWITRVLRYLAHNAGASLYFSSTNN